MRNINLNITWSTSSPRHAAKFMAVGVYACSFSLFG